MPESGRTRLAIGLPAPFESTRLRIPHSLVPGCVLYTGVGPYRRQRGGLTRMFLSHKHLERQARVHGHEATHMMSLRRGLDYKSGTKLTGKVLEFVQFGGEGGIRTREKQGLYAISSRARSSTPAPLQPKCRLTTRRGVPLGRRPSLEAMPPLRSKGHYMQRPMRLSTELRRGNRSASVRNARPFHSALTVFIFDGIYLRRKL